MGRLSKIQHSIAFFQNQKASLLLLFLFLSPALVLVAMTPWDHLAWPDDFVWAFRNTLQQASLSALVCTILGMAFAFGLLGSPAGTWLRRGTELLCLLPLFFPAMFSLLICLEYVQPFPFGVIGISVVHGLIYSGLIAVMNAKSIESRLAGSLELALIEGASARQALWALRRPLLQLAGKSFVLVFSAAFTSFVVPMVVGGGRGTTIEVLIYERIRIDNNLFGATLLSLLQMIFVLLLSAIAPQTILGFERRRSHFPTPLISSRLSLMLTTFFFLLVLMAFGAQVQEGWLQAQQLNGFVEQILQAIPESVGVSFLTSGLCCVLFLFQLLIPTQSLAERGIQGLAQMSPALVGLAVLSVFGLHSYFGFSLAMALLAFPFLWKFFAAAKLHSLRGQAEVAKILGGNSWQTLKIVLLPQMRHELAWVGGLSFFWSMGDISVSKMIFSRDVTLGMIAGNLMSSYRLQASFFVFFLVALLGLLVLGIFHWGAHVIGSKSS